MINPKSSKEQSTLYPVVLSVPDEKRSLERREHVKYLSMHARKALQISAQRSGMVIEKLLKDDSGMPLPFNGIYWSIAHKPEYVAGVVSTEKIGIDIEKIKPCSEGVFKRIANDQELSLITKMSDHYFFRYWTSKEAALKAAGTGFAGLSKCRITKILDNNNLLIDLDGQKKQVEHVFFDHHIATILKDKFKIKWKFL